MPTQEEPKQPEPLLDKNLIADLEKKVEEIESDATDTISGGGFGKLTDGT